MKRVPMVLALLMMAGPGCSDSDGGAEAEAESEAEAEAEAEAEGEMPLVCGDIVAEDLGPEGVATGSTAELEDNFIGSCGTGSALDVLYGFRARGRLAMLEVSLLGSSYDTILHVYRDGCTAEEEIGCNDNVEEGTLQSQLEFADQSAGDYFVVVDGADGWQGPYVLEVSGVIPADEPCDPALGFLACEEGTFCADRGAGFVCLPPLDCADGVDADNDGMTDEDGEDCQDPPEVTCPAATSVAVREPVDLVGNASDDAGLARTWWSVASAPTGNAAGPLPETGSEATFEPLLGGAYALRFSAADSVGHVSACETAVTATVAEGLRVELVWNVTVPVEEDETDLDLHLLHPSATNWFDVFLDCYWLGCEGGGPRWGMPGSGDDPKLDRNVVSGRGPEATTIPAPEQAMDYRIGVHHVFDGGRGPAEAIVNVYCYGVLEETFGPVTLRGSNEDDRQNDFWKVADLSFGASDCTVTELLDVFGEPVVVAAEEAEMGR